MDQHHASSTSARRPTTRTIALRIRDDGAGGARPGAAARRRRPLSGSDLPIGAEPGQGHAVQLDAQSLPRLHPRLPLLLRAPLPDAVRARPRRRVLVASSSSRSTWSRSCGASSIRPSWTREQVALGTATDPYQPIEGHYKLTRRSLEALLAGRTPVGLVTKGPMVVRDARRPRRHRPAARLHGLHERADRGRGRLAALEPGTAHPLQRLRAVRQLRDAGVNVGVLMAPVVPGFTHRAGAARSDDQSDGRSRRRVHRRERDVS